MKFLVNFNNEGWRLFENNGLPYIPEDLSGSIKVVGRQSCVIDAKTKYDLVDYLDSCQVYEGYYEYEEI